MKKKAAFTNFFLAFFLLGSSLALAGNDPSIKGGLRTNVQLSMQSYIEHNTIDGTMYVYDAVKGEMLQLRLEKLHDGIVKKGDFYVSCADFTDQHARKIDIDFLVRPNGTILTTTQAVVHSVADKKRKYHLEG